MAPPNHARKPRPQSVAEVIRAQGVVLEDIRSQMSVVLEAVTSTRTELKADMAALESRLSQRISVLEEVVRQNSNDIRALQGDVTALKGEVAGLKDEVAGLKGEVAGLKDEVARLRYDFDHREEPGRLGALEVRVAAIEQRLRITPR
jgi:hypothetical protein